MHAVAMPLLHTSLCMPLMSPLVQRLGSYLTLTHLMFNLPNMYTWKNVKPGLTFKLASVGNCSGVGSYITTKLGCEAAAASLKVDAYASVLGTPLYAGNNTHYDNPFGCYYKRSTSDLYWSLTGNKNDDDTDRVSLCTTPVGERAACLTLC